MTDVAHMIRTYRAPKTECEVHDTVKVLGWAQWFVYDGQNWLIQRMQASVPRCRLCNAYTSFQIGLPVPNRAIPSNVTISEALISVPGKEMLAR